MRQQLATGESDSIVQGGEKPISQALRAPDPKIVTNEHLPGSLGGESAKVLFQWTMAPSFGWGGDGVIEVHVERVACQRAGCHESGTY